MLPNTIEVSGWGKWYLLAAEREKGGRKAKRKKACVKIFEGLVIRYVA